MSDKVIRELQVECDALVAALRAIRDVADRENGDANDDCLEIRDMADEALEVVK